MKSIGTKLVLQIALVIILVMAAFGILEISQRKQQFTRFLDAKEENSLRQLLLLTGDLLFYVNLELIEQIVTAYLGDTEIWAIKIMEGEELVTYLGKDPDTQERVDFTQGDRQPPLYPDTVKRSRPIVYKEQEIGTLEIVFSRQAIRVQVQETVLALSASIFLVIVLESLMVLLLTRKNIAVPLLNLVHLTRQIADGNIAIRLPKMSSRNEIGKLLLALQDMAEKLRTVMTDVKSVSNDVASESYTINVRADEMSQGSAEQAAAAQEASSFMEQMAANIRQNVDNALQTAKIAEQSAHDAQEGRTAVIETVMAMQ